jgi:hypothetical protein
MKIFAFFIISGLLISCGNSVKKENMDIPVQVSTEQTEPIEQIYYSDFLKTNGDLVEIPSFEIELELSEKAEKKLTQDKESVIVAAYFTSRLDDIAKIPEKYKDRLVFDEMKLLTHTIELTDTRLAKFENLEFPKDLYDLLDDKDIDVLINVVSGKSSTKGNILDCAILSGHVSKIEGERFTLNGGLIGERTIKINNIIF